MTSAAGDLRTLYTLMLGILFEQQGKLALAGQMYLKAPYWLSGSNLRLVPSKFYAIVADHVGDQKHE